MKPTAFISYSHHDTPAVDSLHRDLQLPGLDVWLDVTQIALSQDIPAVFGKAIGRLSCLVHAHHSENSEEIRR